MNTTNINDIKLSFDTLKNNVLVSFNSQQNIINDLLYKIKTLEDTNNSLHNTIETLQSKIKYYQDKDDELNKNSKISIPSSVKDKINMFNKNSEKLHSKPEIKSEIKPEIKPEIKEEVKLEIKEEIKEEIKPEIKEEIKEEKKKKKKKKVINIEN
jgi:hypothetical protein